MLYSEFLDGTKCRDNAHNYGVYKALEALYMDSDASKQDVYKAARPFLDNAKSPEQLRAEAEMLEAIESEERRAEYAAWNIEYYTALEDCRMVKYYREEMRKARAKVKSLRAWLAD